MTPAGGATLTTQVVTAAIPQGWQVRDQNPSTASGYDPKLSDGEGEFFINDNSGVTGDTCKTALQYGMATAKTVGVHNATRQPDQTIGGQTCYVLTGSSGRLLTYLQIGTEVQTSGPPHDVAVTIQFLRKTPNTQAIIDSILATVKFGS